MFKRTVLILVFCPGLVHSAQAQNFTLTDPKAVYGYDREFPPYSFQEPGGKPTGFEVELVEAIFRNSGVNLQFRPLAWDMIQTELANGLISFTSGMIPTVQRKELYLFSQRPTVSANIRFFTKNYNRVANISLLRGQAVAAEENSYSLRLMEQYGGIIVKPYPNRQDGIRALYDDYVFAYCGLEANTYYIMNKLRFTGISAMGTPLNLAEMYFAVNRERPDVKRLLDEGMSRIIANGEYEAIYRRWFVTEIDEAIREDLIKKATEAAISAYAPYSGKTHGAAVLTIAGNTYVGSSLENADSKLNISALRSALAHAAAAGDMEVRAVVSVDQNGNVQKPEKDDLQTVYEFYRGGLFIMGDQENGYVTKTAGELLPNPVSSRPVQAVHEW
ncbi:MAG: transporter substrate-binding domain-containing protein [Desulfovibrionaceae bacterium]|nr:transporter substrate-binding domain-containing protein [Desulfovibrionaceae bacterium]